MIQHTQFLDGIRNYVKQHPEVAAHVATFVQEGIAAALKESNERAADMEVAVATLIAKRFKDWDSLVLEKLKKWNGRSALRWDDAIDRMQK